MTESQPLISTNLPFPKKSGKVRDVYDLGEQLLIVSTDRISAFDWILPTGIPDKGRVLTQTSEFWFEYLGVEHHLLGTDVAKMGLELSSELENALQGRVMLTRKAEVVPFECVVRGYLEGSGWREYQKDQAVCGLPLPAGLVQCSRLDEPLFTPATKAEEGHDQNVSFEFMADALGNQLAEELKARSLEVYLKGAQYALSKGIIIADTKFEWGICDGQLILIDEVLTPDSSRFWAADSYEPGGAQPSFDKQFVREWLMRSTWDQNSEPPMLPPHIVSETRRKYIEVFERLTDLEFGD